MEAVPLEEIGGVAQIGSVEAFGKAAVQRLDQPASLGQLAALYLRSLRAAADRGGFPLILDEIQSGMGRTGTFLASEPAGVHGDYYLFSKALGGGLAKIAALLVDKARYVDRFGYLHTSTFADVVICATNAPEPLIRPEHLGDQPLVICDVSVPGDVDPAVGLERPRARVIRGGIVQLPRGQSLSFPGMALPNGQLYACLSEVAPLGLAGVGGHFSYGPLRPERVRQIRRLAELHGFGVATNST